MAPSRRRRPFQFQENDPGVITAPVNTDPGGGLHTGSLSPAPITSTAGIALANPPLPVRASVAPAAGQPIVLAGSAADSARAVGQSARAFRGFAQPAGGVGKIGQVAAPPDQQPDTRTVDAAGNTSIGTPSGGSVSIPAAGTTDDLPTGIFVDGRSVTHGANDASGRPTLVDAPAGQSFNDQQAEILRRFPQVGVAGTSENKQFVDAFNSGGQDKTGALALAESVFAPKTQAQAIAQDRATGQATARQQAVTDAANQTPEQRAALVAKGTANQAKLDAAGAQVEKDNPLAKQIGGGIVDGLNSFDSTLRGLPGKIARPFQNFFAGAGSTELSTPADPNYTGQRGVTAPIQPISQTPTILGATRTTPPTTGLNLAAGTGAPPPTPLAFRTPLTVPASTVAGSTITATDIRTPQAPAVTTEGAAIERNANLGRTPRALTLGLDPEEAERRRKAAAGSVAAAF